MTLKRKGFAFSGQGVTRNLSDQKGALIREKLTIRAQTHKPTGRKSNTVCY